MPVYLPEAYLWPCESSTMDQFYETTELHFKSTIKTLEQNVKAICVVLVFYCSLWRYFTPCSSVSFTNFAMAGWAVCPGKILFNRKFSSYLLEILFWRPKVISIQTLLLMLSVIKISCFDRSLSVSYWNSYNIKKNNAMLTLIHVYEKWIMYFVSEIKLSWLCLHCQPNDSISLKKLHVSSIFTKTPT